ncbi:ImuA family protein [Tabrizicola sp.]|uniref:ImuA family protein n=1 Tax=Tabrizicola sp. TaxID=2005166 RepID=UPI0035AEAC6B
MSLPIHHHAPRRGEAQQPLAGDLTLQRGRVHELCGPSRMMLAARIMAKCQGPVVWIRPGWTPERLNAAGLQPLAAPSRLILVQAPRDDSLLWAAEEALRSGAAPLVIAELLAAPALTPTRRLHLAAETGAEAARRDGATPPLGLILLPGQGGAQGVESRWHLAPAPSRALLWSDEDSFTLTRLRARLLPPASWTLHATSKDEVLDPRPLPDL